MFITTIRNTLNHFLFAANQYLFSKLTFQHERLKKKRNKDLFLSKKEKSKLAFFKIVFQKDKGKHLKCY